MRVILLLCLFVAVAYAQNGTCCSPIFRDRTDWWSNCCHNLSEPITTANSQGVCSYITQSGPSCCTTGDYFVITLIWATARDIIQGTVNVWRTELALYEIEQAAWKSILNNITANSTLDSNTKKRYQYFIQQSLFCY